MSERDALKELEEWMREDPHREADMGTCLNGNIALNLTRLDKIWGAKEPTLSEAITKALDEARKG